MIDLAGWYVIEHRAGGLGDLCTLTLPCVVTQSKQWFLDRVDGVVE